MKLLGSLTEIKSEKFRDTAGNLFTISLSAQTADRTATIPVLSGNDAFVFAEATQTLTNKTLPIGASNNIMGINDTVAGYLSGITQDVQDFMDGITAMTGYGGSKGSALTALTAGDLANLAGTTSNIQAQFAANDVEHAAFTARLDAMEGGFPEATTIFVSSATYEDTDISPWHFILAQRTGSCVITLRDHPIGNMFYQIKNECTSDVLLQCNNGVTIGGNANYTLLSGAFVWLGLHGNAWFIMDESVVTSPDALTGPTVHLTADAEDMTTDPLVFAYATGGTAIVYTLRASPVTSNTYQIKNASSEPLTINGNERDIAGNPTLVLAAGAWVWLRCHGGSWYVAADSSGTGGGGSGGVTSESQVITTDTAADISIKSLLFVEKTYVGAATFTLSSAPSLEDTRQIKNSAAGALTVQGNGKNIAGQASITVEADAWVWLRYNGTSWYIADQAQTTVTDISAKFIVAPWQSVTAGNIVQLMSGGVANLPSFVDESENVSLGYDSYGPSVLPLDAERILVHNSDHGGTGYYVDRLTLTAYTRDGAYLNSGVPFNTHVAENESHILVHSTSHMATFDGELTVVPASIAVLLDPTPPAQYSSVTNTLGIYRVVDTSLQLLNTVNSLGRYEALKTMNSSTMMGIRTSDYESYYVATVGRSGLTVTERESAFFASGTRGYYHAPGLCPVSSSQALLVLRTTYTGEVVTGLATLSGYNISVASTNNGVLGAYELSTASATSSKCVTAFTTTNGELQAFVSSIAGTNVTNTAATTLVASNVSQVGLSIARISDDVLAVAYDDSASSNIKVAVMTLTGTTMTLQTPFTVPSYRQVLSLDVISADTLLLTSLDPVLNVRRLARVGDAITEFESPYLVPGSRLLGYALTSGDSGEEVSISFGPIVSGFTNLVQGSSYYCAAPGIGRSNIGEEYLAGVAVSATSFALRSFN